MTHGERCQSFGKRNLIFHIRLPNQIGGLGFFFQIVIQRVLENYEILGKHHISF
jgi:hypothetical protein